MRMCFGHISPLALKGLFRPSCCDDAMVIRGCMARLNKNNRNLHDLLMDYYVMGTMLMILDIRLEME